MLISYTTWQNIQKNEEGDLHANIFLLEPKRSSHHGAKIAGEITRIHSEVTGAPSFFAQVIP
jgi:hypothetical protein